jgi:hypothetical protein
VRPIALIISLLTLVPAGASSARSTPFNRAHELQVLESEERQIRGLAQLRPVQARFLSNAAYNALVSHQMKRDNPLSEIAIGQRELDEVGFLRPGQSLRKIYFSDIGSKTAGVYDYKTRTLYVRKTNQRAFQLERYVIVHEYTHALQDQHWHLSRLLPDEYKLHYRDSDAAVAHRALLEGDAVNTEELYWDRYYTRAEFSAMLRYEKGLSTGAALPWAINADFYFPYTSGVTFVQALYRTGGMRRIDQAFSRLPSSTYEILFPREYLRGWRPAAVRLHGVRGFPGWKQVDDDVFGAFGYMKLLWQHGTETQAEAAVRAYRGDRYIFLEKGSKSLLLMKSVWAGPVTARAAARRLSAALTKRFGRKAEWNSSHEVLSARGLAVYDHATGDSVTLAYAPSARLAARLGAAATSLSRKPRSPVKRAS